jgi:hypothetical protein
LEGDCEPPPRLVENFVFVFGLLILDVACLQASSATDWVHAMCDGTGFRGKRVGEGLQLIEAKAIQEG